MRLNSSIQRNADFQFEVQLEVLRRLYQYPATSQRTLAKDLGISLGSINFCFKALVSKGLIKVENFSQSKNKLSYVYLLTPAGIAQKSILTTKFLRRKVREYEMLESEIKLLKSEIEMFKSVQD